MVSVYFKDAAEANKPSKFKDLQNKSPGLLSVILRATAFGVLNALCKLAAILGSSIFTSFVGVTKAVPVLLSFAALVGGGLVALKLPDTRQKILQ